MRGALISVFSLFCVVLFSACLFLSDSLALFWLFLELGALSLIPCFFLHSEGYVLSSLFNYIIVSGVSSSLIVCGLIFEDVVVLLFVGLLIKFGMFPFMSWVYKVVINSNWLVVWALSTVLKSGVLMLGYFFWTGADFFLAECSGVLTLLVISGLFWLYTEGWTYYWCHVMISSSATLVIMSVSGSLDSLFYLFLVYVVWSTCVLLLLSSFNEMSVNSGAYFLAVFFLVSFPFSASLFYKLVVSFCIFSCSVWVILSWVAYNISEQFFLVKWLIVSALPRSEWSGSSGV